MPLSGATTKFVQGWLGVEISERALHVSTAFVGFESLIKFADGSHRVETCLVITYHAVVITLTLVSKKDISQLPRFTEQPINNIVESLITHTPRWMGQSMGFEGLCMRC